MVRPSALAVFRFTTSSNLVGLNRQIAGFRALQDLVHVNGCAAVQGGTVGAIGQKTASVRERRIVIYRRQAALYCKARYLFYIRARHGVCQGDKSARARLDCVFERLVEIVGAPYFQRMKLDS